MNILKSKTALAESNEQVTPNDKLLIKEAQEATWEDLDNV